MHGQLHPAIEMFHLLDSMKWPVVGPEEGSLYQQDPEILECFGFIFNERNKIKAEQQKKQERETQKARNPGSKPGRRRR